MTDLSVQSPCGVGQRVANALLRGNGATTALLQMPPLTGDGTDQGQVGLHAPGFQFLPLAPGVFRRLQVAMRDGEEPEYELLIAADAVAAQVSAKNLSSGEALFALAGGVVVAGRLFLIEALSTSESQGQVYLYRLLLREACGQWQE